MSNVYVITHVPSGRKYVGKANNVQKRWRQHFTEAASGTGHYLHAAIRKYGREQFSLTNVFSFGNEDDALVAENLCIKALKANVKGKGFNLESGGRGGKSPAESTRKKLSDALKGRIKTPEHVEKIRLANTGLKRSPEQVERHRQKVKGRKRTPEQRARMSISFMGRIQTPDIRAKISATKRAKIAAAKAEAPRG